MKLGLALAFSIAGVAACSSESGPAAYQGYAEGDYLRVAAPFAGTLAQLAVKRGDSVQPGTALYTLEQESERAALAEAEEKVRRADAQLDNLRKSRRPSEIAAVRAQREQAGAALKLSELSFQREERLAGQGFVSKQKLDDARAARERDGARVAELDAQLLTAKLAARSDEIRAAEAEAQAARAALKQAQWKLAQKTVTALRAGSVEDILYTQGEWVQAGSPVVVLLPPENRKVRFFVPENRLGELKIGLPIAVHCDGCGQPLPATVSFIAAQAEYTPPVLYNRENRAKLLYLVEARLAVEHAVKLHPGQPLDVRLTANK